MSNNDTVSKTHQRVPEWLIRMVIDTAQIIICVGLYSDFCAQVLGIQIRTTFLSEKGLLRSVPIRSNTKEMSKTEHGIIELCKNNGLIMNAGCELNKFVV